MAPEPDSAAVEAALAAQLHDGERYRPFGELTGADVAGQAERMGDLQGWGPLDRVRPIAETWRALARELADGDAQTVADLPGETVVDYASRLWLTEPPGGLIK